MNKASSMSLQGLTQRKKKKKKEQFSMENLNIF